MTDHDSHQPPGSSSAPPKPEPQPDPEPVESVLLDRGAIHIARALYERHFAGVEAVALLRCDDDLLILPVRHHAGGGYLLKRKNAAGDRVVIAVDFFRTFADAGGMPSRGPVADEMPMRRMAATWSDERAALVVPDVFAARKM